MASACAPARPADDAYGPSLKSHFLCQHQGLIAPKVRRLPVATRGFPILVPLLKSPNVKLLSELDDNARNPLPPCTCAAYRNQGCLLQVVQTGEEPVATLGGSLVGVGGMGLLFGPSEFSDFGA